MSYLNRRQFLKNSAFASMAFSSLPLLNACLQTDKKRTLSFTGQLMGEEVNTAHQIRDRFADFTQTEKAEKDQHRYDVLIIGGGPSGLSTAMRLQQAGINNVLIVDKEDRMGGLCKGNTSAQGLDYCFGAHYIDYPTKANKPLVDVLNRCGVLDGFGPSDEPLVNPHFLLREPEHNLFTNQGWEFADYPHRLANQQDSDELARFHEEARYWSNWKDEQGRPALGLPLANCSGHNTIKELDATSMSNYLKEKGFKSELLYWFVNIWLIDEYGTTIEQCSAWAGFHFFRASTVDDKISRTITFAKGLGYLTQRMAKLLQAKQEPHTYATLVQNDGDGASALLYNYQDKRLRQVHAKHIVFAIPKQQALYLIPELMSAGRTEFVGINYAPWLITVLHTKALPNYPDHGGAAWENTIYDSFTMGYVNNQHHEVGRRADQPHVLTLYSCFPDLSKGDRMRMLNNDWEYWAKISLAELEKAHPNIEQLIDRMDIWRWGHPMRQTLPGAVFGEKTQRMKQPLGRIHFGHVDTTGLPVFEEAVYRGYQVATDILKVLNKT